ncbi:MAG TPA: hypothetical protein VMW73_10200 [Spirochaetia bacterium]|nr:hypothetical protein [Spirochaetia bacterium]
MAYRGNELDQGYREERGYNSRSAVATGWDQILGEATAAGIPVILVDRGIKAAPSLYATVIVGGYIKEFADIHIVFDQTGNFTRSGGLQVME